MKKCLMSYCFQNQPATIFYSREDEIEKKDKKEKVLIKYTIMSMSVAESIQQQQQHQ